MIRSALFLVMVSQAFGLNFANVYEQTGPGNPVVCARPGGGYLLATGDLSLLWLDDTGAVLQAYRYVGQQIALGPVVDIFAISDGYIVIGDAANAADGKYVMKLSSSGNVIWTVVHPELHEIKSGIETSDNAILVGGLAEPQANSYRPALWKINSSNGSTVWDYYFWTSSTNDRFALNGVCEFNGYYYANISRRKSVGLNIWSFPAILKIDQHCSAPIISDLHNAIDSSWVIDPAGIIVTGGREPQILASWCGGANAHYYNRYHVWFTDFNSSPVPLQRYHRSYVFSTNPLKSSPDTSLFYLVSSPRLTKFNATGTPLWEILLSDYSNGGNLSVADNGDPLVTYISSGYTYPIMLSRLETSNGDVCISTATTAPSQITVYGNWDTGAITPYSMGTPQSISVTRDVISPLLDVVCTPLYMELERDAYNTDLTMHAWTTKGKLNVELNVASEARVSLSIFDATGRLCTNLCNKSLLGGSYRFTARMNSGVYTVLLNANDSDGDQFQLTKTVVVAP